MTGSVIGRIQFHSGHNEDSVEKIISELRPGEGKAIYNANAVDNQFTQQTNYALTDWSESFESLQHKLEPWLPLFPANDRVEKIQVYYGFHNLTTQEIEEMIEESSTTGHSIVVRDLQPNNKLVGVNITYQSAAGMYSFRIFGTTKSRIQVPDHSHASIDTIQVRGNSAFYISNPDNQQLIWIEEDSNGKALQYEIMGKDMNKDIILSIVESMM